MENRDTTGGEFGEIPNDKYRQFFEKFSETQSLPIEEWKPVHLIGYFCQKYRDLYRISYSFKFNSPAPSKCFEVFQMKKLGMHLSTQPAMIKAYIDWIFQNKVEVLKRRFTSISFLTKEDHLFEYKRNLLQQQAASNNSTDQKIDRSTELPPNFIEILQKHNLRTTTYGALSFLAQMDATPQIQGAFSELESAGFDKSSLRKVV